MPRSSMNKGCCYLCGKDFGKGAMNTHLNKVHLPIEMGDTPYFLIKVEFYYTKDYWFYVQVNVNSTLQVLDAFLRTIWLECCGHLSSFHIDGQDYDVAVEDGDGDWNEFFGSDTLPMNEVTLQDAMEPGMVFTHEYDFGTTTLLKLTVMDAYQGKDIEEITLLARNLPLAFTCSKCDEPAVYVDATSRWVEEPLYYCQKCGKKVEKKDEVYLLPITNSPRMGVCAYDGEQDHYGTETVKR